MSEELYRCIGKTEIVKLISGDVIKNIYKLQGMSFTKNKRFALKHHFDNKYPNNFIITFDYDIVKSNFKYIEYVYTYDWIMSHLKLWYNIYGGTLRETFEEYEELVKSDKRYVTAGLPLFKSMQEVLVKEYWFIPGLILNIEDRFDQQQNITWLANFIQQNQDKLNLQL